MNHYELETIINKELLSGTFKDYVPNGLQVEGRIEVKRIMTGVTACQNLLDQAVSQGVDAIFVHHGYFWKNELAVIKGIKRKRLHTLLSNGINLYAWHLPLDAHLKLGNNVQLANLLGINVRGKITPFVFWGELENPLNPKELSNHIEKQLDRTPFCFFPTFDVSKKIRFLAWCSGAGQDFIEDCFQFGFDTYITGEVSEKTIHFSREQGICFFAAGHHATERAGIQALGKWVQENYHLDVTFFDVPNPI